MTKKCLYSYYQYLLNVKRGTNMKLIFLGSGGGRFRDHNPEEDDWWI
jgi:hypothetical protein